MPSTSGVALCFVVLGVASFAASALECTTVDPNNAAQCASCDAGKTFSKPSGRDTAAFPCRKVTVCAPPNHGGMRTPNFANFPYQDANCAVCQRDQWSPSGRHLWGAARECKAQTKCKAKKDGGFGYATECVIDNSMYAQMDKTVDVESERGCLWDSACNPPRNSDVKLPGSGLTGPTTTVVTTDYVVEGTVVFPNGMYSKSSEFVEKHQNAVRVGLLQMINTVALGAAADLGFESLASRKAASPYPDNVRAVYTTECSETNRQCVAFDYAVEVGSLGDATLVRTKLGTIGTGAGKLELSSAIKESTKSLAEASATLRGNEGNYREQVQKELEDYATLDAIDYSKLGGFLSHSLNFEEYPVKRSLIVPTASKTATAAAAQQSVDGKGGAWNKEPMLGGGEGVIALIIIAVLVVLGGGFGYMVYKKRTRVSGQVELGDEHL